MSSVEPRSATQNVLHNTTLSTSRRDVAGPGPHVVQELPVLTTTWRRVVDSPILVAVVTVVVATVTTAAALDWSGLAAVLTGPGASAGAAGAVLLVISLLVGLPHGAVDLLRPEMLPPGASSRRRRAVSAAYLGCALVAVGCWLLVPLPTLLVLLGLAAVHFGTADEVVNRWRRVTPPVSSTTSKTVGLLAAGGLPVAVPLGLHGEAVRGVLEGLSGGRAGTVIACARICSVPVLAAAVIAVVAALVRRRWLAAVETVALAGLFVLVTPLLAFAVYFGLWHSWRQVVRMVAIDSVRDHTSAAAALERFSRSAVLPTALTVVAAAVAVVVGGTSVLVVGLALVLCLTVPHSIAVARSDKTLRLPPVQSRPVQSPLVQPPLVQPRSD